MKSRIFAIIGLLFLAGCASHPIKNDVFEKIHQGDSADSVRNLLGPPDSYEPVPNVVGGNWWIYSRRGDYCYFGIQNNQVQSLACQDNPNYHNAAQVLALAIASGADAGKNAIQQQQQQNRSVSCTTNQVGNTAYTNCQGQ